MRNPDRLDIFYEEFKKIHKERFPDLRFGQLISNFFGWIYQEKKKDFFFPEEGEMLSLFREFAEGLNEKKNT